MRPLVLSSGGATPSWAVRLENPVAGRPDALPPDMAEFGSVWIDAVNTQPLRVARDVAARDATVQTVVVAPREDRSIHERALLFTPGLGEVWLVGPEEVGAGTLERAHEVTGTRRRYRDSRGQWSQKLERLNEGSPRRAVVSDAYLAALLGVLPDPVISVDEADRIVSWSDAAERCLGIADAQALGRPVLEVLRPDAPDDLTAALEKGREQVSRLELTLQGDSTRLTMEVVVTPVAVGGISVRTLVLRDVTRERESLARLEQEVERRSRSYAAMSHEIRTPINAIMGYNELLRMEEVTADKREEYLLRSQKAASHLLELVNDVLDLSKLESGVLEIQRQPVQVDEVMHDLVSTVEPMANERETPLDVLCKTRAGEIWTDRKRLQQILINLVSNAVKFGEKRPVRVECERDGSWITFRVIDEGRGIDPSELDRIFEEFIQVGDTREGTGLGLPISRKLAELLGGRLTAESKLGEGSTFQVILPIEAPATEPNEAPR